MSDEALPIILVSAGDAGAAQTLISELIDNVVEGDDEGSSADGARVWELSNKYYTARVRVCACAGDPPPSPSPCPARTQPDAHIIYLAENECTSGSALTTRAAAIATAEAGEGDGECAVRLALCACERDDYSAELRQAARAHGYELVSLRETPPAAEGPFPELAGLARAREALHAHTWPGLRLRRQPARPAPCAPHTPRALPRGEDDDEFSPFQSFQNGDCESPGCSSPEPDAEECVRRAELLADALGALSAARDLAAGPGGGAGAGAGAERRLRAEAVVAAFARALGTDIDSL